MMTAIIFYGKLFNDSVYLVYVKEKSYCASVIDRAVEGLLS